MEEPPDATDLATRMMPRTVETPSAIPLCEPYFTGTEWDYVKDCLDSGWVSSAGAWVEQFEANLAEFVGTKFAVAVGSGTAALHLSLLASGIRANDIVLVPDLTFISPANATTYVGAIPHFIDVDAQYWQISPDGLEDFFERECSPSIDGPVHSASGRPVRAILAVDLLGHPFDSARLSAIADANRVRLLEDATESLGAKSYGRSVGTLGVAGSLSFNGNKLITTGGGGAVVTDDEAIATRIRYLSTQAKDDPIESIHGAIGFNYRLSNVQAAMGCAQLESIDQRIARKREIFANYHAGLDGLAGISCPDPAPWAESAHWLTSVIVNPDEYGMNSRQLMRSLGERGIETRPLWQPMHASPAHPADQGRDFPVAARLAASVLSLPSSVGLSQAQQEQVINAIRAAPMGT